MLQSELPFWAEHRLASGKGLLEGPPASGVGSPPFIGEWSLELCEERLYLLEVFADFSGKGNLAAKDLVRSCFPEVVQIISRLGEMLDPVVRFLGFVLGFRLRVGLGVGFSYVW